nr:EF-hand domain-containing protein [Bizionia gelidisalsuginis]
MPLKDDFSKVDTNGDSYITTEELNKAPKPKGHQPSKRK